MINHDIIKNYANVSGVYYKYIFSHERLLVRDKSSHLNLTEKYFNKRSFSTITYRNFENKAIMASQESTPVYLNP
jgi:hypothetical protein